MLAIVSLSYRQTIKAYPNGASSYIVAGDNLGDDAGILAASALLIGYVVTVAVSVSAGVAAMTSIIPELFDYRVYISVAAVALLMLGNLRGIRESGTIFMAPTYLYITVMLGIVVLGFGRMLFGGGLPQYDGPAGWSEQLESAGAALGLFLVLRAFSQGAVALTGVEAISDGVPAFKPPEWQNARTTLTWAAAIFGIMFLGIAVLATASGIVPDPDEQQTVLSMLVRQHRRIGLDPDPGPGGHGADPGAGRQHQLRRLPAPLVLPGARRLPAAPVRLPRRAPGLHHRDRGPLRPGDRLLIVVFQASVSGLIPLYTLGVFIAFTLSQGGMLMRWYPAARAGMAAGAWRSTAWARSPRSW